MPHTPDPALTPTPSPAAGRGEWVLPPSQGRERGPGGEGLSGGEARSRLRRLASTVKAFLYGMTAYEFERHALAERARLEDLFALITLGDLIGVPILPPYYSLRLLPFAVPRLEAWKRRMLRERHALENEEYDLIEL